MINLNINIYETSDNTVFQVLFHKLNFKILRFVEEGKKTNYDQIISGRCLIADGNVELSFGRNSICLSA